MKLQKESGQGKESMMASEKKQENQAITSQKLHEEWTEERKRQGMKEIPPINNAMGTSTGNLASADKSWKNAPDFFVKMLQKEKK